jgi:hypothetical protein
MYDLVHAAIIGLPDDAKQTSYLSASEPKTRPIVTRLAKDGLLKRHVVLPELHPWVFSFLQHHLQQNRRLVGWRCVSPKSQPTTVFKNRKKKLKIMCPTVTTIAGCTMTIEQTLASYI